MPEDHAALRKVGRGGAGNFIPAKQVDEASKQDLEAQELNVPVAPVPSTSSSSHPTRAGRGGAGNFVDSAQSAREQELLAEETAAAVTSSLKKNPHPHRAGWSGRGGAGNFTGQGTAEHAKQQEEEENNNKTKKAEMERKIKEAVDGALKLPEKVHHNPGQDAEIGL